MRLSPEIIRAVSLACDQLGSKKNFAESIGVHPSCVGRWLDGLIKKVDDDTWERLKPAISGYLKQENPSSYLFPVYSQNGDYLGDWPAIPGAEFSVLIESDTFIESLPINCLAVLGSILEPVRGELISTADTPYQFGRYQISILPKTSYRKVVNITIFPGGNPKKYLIKK